MNNHDKQWSSCSYLRWDPPNDFWTSSTILFQNKSKKVYQKDDKSQQRWPLLCGTVGWHDICPFWKWPRMHCLTWRGRPASIWPRIWHGMDSFKASTGPPMCNWHRLEFAGHDGHPLQGTCRFQLPSLATRCAASGQSSFASLRWTQQPCLSWISLNTCLQR